MNRSALLKRAGIGVVILIVLALVTVLGVGTYTVRRPLPTVDGSIHLPGFADTVTVQRDARGIPTITASNDLDLMRAQGYVHAQDRFFQMDYRRHVTAGRLAELVGPVQAAIDADRVIRTFGWRRVAEQEWKVISEESRALLTAYAEGVNTYISGRESSQLAAEYTVLGLAVAVPEIEPWTPIDSLAWLKAMAWDLRNNYEDELLRAQAAADLGDYNAVDSLFPPYPAEQRAPIIPDGTAPQAPVVTPPDSLPPALPLPEPTNTSAPEAGPALDPAEISDDDASRALAAASRALQAVPQLVGGGEGTGSNSFVIAGTHTATGKPIVANDPHLGVSQPGIWHQVGLACTEKTTDCTFNVSGFSMAGMPGVVIGHNDELAWGLTNTGADVTDFFLERLTSDKSYLRDGQETELQVHNETINVAGGEPIELTVRATVHGPIISDVLPTDAISALPVPAGSPSAGDGYAVSLAWTALQPGRTMDAVFAIDRATDQAEVAAAAELFEVPAQNIVWANTDGDIGYQMPGRIPVRGIAVQAVLPADGTWPRPGWDSAFDWTGYLQGADLPSAVNPEDGFIVAANQAIQAPGESPFVGRDFDFGYRSQQLRGRISADIAAGTPITVARANEYMLEDGNPYAAAVVPAILALDVHDRFLRLAVDQLRSWAEEGYPQRVDSPGAAFFASIWAHLLKLTFHDDLPNAQLTNSSRWLQVVEKLLEDPESAWWDDRTTVSVRETRDEILQQALQQARMELTNSQAKDPSEWRWGNLHQYAPEHDVLGGEDIPGLVRWFFNAHPVEVAGGSGIVNATGWNPRVDEYGRVNYTVTTAPSMRMVADMSDLDRSTWVNMTGNSGHPASKNYEDQNGPWARGETFAWPFTPSAVKEAAVATLEIQPR